MEKALGYLVGSELNMSQQCALAVREDQQYLLGCMNKGIGRKLWEMITYPSLHLLGSTYIHV